ncbi:PLP-dependent aminotransferase family protein [Pendulispora albinea]|uniref:PLP-dependent aminotransferase family protein n=1 Tax=Pendulispora albinea TaxID=2741071 RepID=A0ABZ2M845_9BACT
MESYQTIADAMAADILAGRLRPGDRLPPQRELADRRGIAVSTASRVYAELIRRGLAVGEVGRGTYVRAAAKPPGPTLVEPPDAPVDLELNYCILPEQIDAMAPVLSAIAAPTGRGALADALRPVGASATSAAREATAAFLARGGWTPDPANVLFAGAGRQAIAVAMAALAPVGGHIGVEALTYPIVRGIAARIGVTLEPLALDAEGLRPEAVVHAHRARPLSAIYVQPTLHNPLGTTMSRARREELADVLKDTGIVAIEDAIYSFLADEEPLATFAPDRTILVDSLSKRLAPGLNVGFLVAPERLTEKLATTIRSGGWLANGFALAAGLRWMTDGTAARIAEAKRQKAARGHRLAVELLDGLTVRGDPRAFHVWVELPNTWRADTFAAAAGRLGIALTPASAFTIGAGHAPNAVRLALASPPHDAAARALRKLRQLAMASDYEADLDGFAFSQAMTSSAFLSGGKTG